jgi:hypothetical protein
MIGIYLTEEGKQEIEAKVAELEKNVKHFELIMVYNPVAIKAQLFVFKEILSSATILPVEENWENIKDLLDINTFPISYKNGVIIKQ